MSLPSGSTAGGGRSASPVFLGIDVGTFETKGVLVDANGVVLADARRRHGISSPAAGQVEQDPVSVWWADVTGVAAELTAQVSVGDRIAAVGMSAIGPCVVATDAALEPLRPAILYGIDTRATEQGEALTERLGAEEIYRRSGNLLTSQSSGPKIAWLKEHEPEVWRQARWFMTSQSWLVAKLTGEVVIDHGTAGYYHPLYDLAEGRWDVTGCEDFIDAERLPRLAWSTEIAGRVHAEAAAATGIPAGTPVIVGTTDAPAEAVGSGVVDAGTLMAMYGSSGYFIRVGTEPESHPDLWAAPFVFEGTYVLAAGTSTAGTATRWIGDLLAATGDSDQVTFGRLMELAAASEPGARGVLALPHLAGERTPFQDPLSRGAFIGLGLEHTRADVARALFEGVGHSIAEAIGTYRRADAPISRIIAVGGATRNQFIIETVSTVTGLEQEIADSPGAAYGDAFLAALAVGELVEPADIGRWINAPRVVRPDPASAAVLEADHRAYVALYEALAPLQHQRTPT